MFPWIQRNLHPAVVSKFNELTEGWDQSDINDAHSALDEVTAVFEGQLFSVVTNDMVSYVNGMDYQDETGTGGS